MQNRIFIARSAQELEKCLPVLKELRPHLEPKEFLSIFSNAHIQDGYELMAIQEQGKILALMGYRILFDFVRGKYLYVDDLVSTESHRSQGLGAELLEQAEKIAKEQKCSGLRLCAILENEHAIRFYEKHGWTKRAYAFSKKFSE